MRLRKTGYVYILTNRWHTVLYVGVTNNITRRVAEHRARKPKSFSCQYNLTKLVYLERYDYIKDAIVREKQLKAGSRARKVTLINRLNPQWRDLLPAEIARRR